jgi:hypothetical protein
MLYFLPDYSEQLERIRKSVATTVSKTPSGQKKGHGIFSLEAMFC